MDEKTVFQPRFEGVRPGVRLNGIYEIERLVAQGGMGEVYRGFNVETRDPVAIKMIRAEMSGDSDIIALFRREASTLFNLHNEAIVRYFVFTVDPALQRAYLAMEFVEGPSLANRIAERPLSTEEARILVTRIGGALDAAHRLGVIHRDLSPDNIILPDGDVRKAKLIDFGIARSLQSSERTIIGDGFAGKYNYVSPEQLGLNGGQVTGKSDIYSFGLVLAEALGGRPIDMGGTTLEVVEKRRRVPDLTKLPAEFRPLLQNMLKPNPVERPASMAAVAAALDRVGPARKAGASGGGGFVVWLALALIVISLGGLGYVFRDDLQRMIGGSTTKPQSEKTATPTPEPTPSPTTTIPPLPTDTPTTPSLPTDTSTPPLPAETPTHGETPTTPSTPASQHTPQPPTPEEILDVKPPSAPSPSIDLTDAALGKAYHAVLPAFTTPGGKALHLTVLGLPDGLSFRDRGDGSAEISGTPTRAGAFVADVRATDHNGRIAEMKVNIPVSAPVRLAQPSQSSVILSPATVGRDYSAALPPFRLGADSRGLVLRVEPELPEGLQFSDQGAGFSTLAGRPAKAGVFTFDITSSDVNGAGGRMTIRLTIAPGAGPTVKATPVEPTTPIATVTSTPGFVVPGTPIQTPPSTPAATETPTPTDPAEMRRAFLKSYDGGACFFAGLRPGDPDPNAVNSAAGNLDAFSRFETDYKREFDVAPVITAALLSPGQCPLVELLKLTAIAATQVPRITLDSTTVDGSHPLAGRVAGLGGRHLQILLIDNDGDAIALRSVPDSERASATFSVQLQQGDKNSIGKVQALVAIVSDAPLQAFSNVRLKTAAALVSALHSEWGAPNAGAAVEYFLFGR